MWTAGKFISLSFTKPQVVPKLCEFLFFFWTKKKIFLKNVQNEQFTVATDFNSIEKNTMELEVQNEDL